MKIHFIGIGGIGISALAQYFLALGHKISGSDLTRSEITDFLKKKGAKIYIGHKSVKLKAQSAKQQSKTKNSISPDLVIYSPAVKPDNPELREARKLGIKCQTYPEALGELTKKYFTIAVSGTHGKSTTTAMVSLILIKSGFNPTVFIGTKLKEFGNGLTSLTTGSNFRIGKSNYLVIEADEYESSFLNYWPKIIVLINLEYEHPDYFKNFSHYLSVFKEFVARLPKNGVLIANKDDKSIAQLKAKISKINLKNKNYSLKQKDAQKIKAILKIPGAHNISNALAALTVARTLKITDKISFKALSEYKGAWRRFEERNLKFKNLKLKIISDYAHHPTQVKVTIAAAKEKYPNSKLWVIYQAHQYLRTYYLFDNYVKAFDQADEVIMPEIYGVAGREKKEISEKLSAKKLADAVKKRFKKIGKKSKVHFLKDYKTIPNFLKNRVKNGDVILLMGAGDIYKLIEKLYHINSSK